MKHMYGGTRYGAAVTYVRSHAKQNCTVIGADLLVNRTHRARVTGMCYVSQDRSPGSPSFVLRVTFPRPSF